MSKEEKDAFIAEAIRGLDAEGQVHAVEELNEQLPVEGEYQVATKRLKHASFGKVSIMKIGLIVLMILSFILMLTVKNTSVIMQARELSANIPAIDIFSPMPPELPKRDIGFTVEEKRIVYGSMNASGSLQLWQEDPENAALFAHYIERYKDENDLYPEDTTEVAEKIDPDNGLYDLLQGVVSRKSVAFRQECRDVIRRINDLKERKLEYGELSVKAESELKSQNSKLASMVQYDIKDEKKFEASINHIKRAFTEPYIKESYKRFEQKRNAIILNRLNRDDFLKRSQCALVIGMQPMNGKLSMVTTSNLLSAYYEKLVAEGNVEEIKWWLPRHVWYWRQRVESIDSILDSIVLRAEMNVASTAMLKAAKLVGMDDMEEKFAQFDQALKQDRELLESSDKISAMLNNNKLSMLMRMTVFLDSKVLGDTGVKKEALAISRYTDHAIAGRVFSTFAWLIFAFVLLGVWLYQFMRKSYLTPLGLRFRNGLNYTDWIIILSLGVLLPIMFYWVLNHLTKLSAREWSIYFVNGVATIGQFYAMFLAIITTSICVLRWRVGKIYSFLVWNASRWSGSMAVSSFLAMISAGLISEKSNAMFWVTCALTVMVTLYLLVNAVRFYVKGASIEKYTVNRILTPVLIVAMLMMTVMTACFYQVEKHYVAKDTLLSLDPKTGYSNYESIVTKQAKKELQERLDMLDGIELEN